MRETILLLILLTAFNFYSAGQAANGTVGITLPSVSLLDIEPASALNLAFITPLEAGNSIQNPITNTSKWINYTCAIKSTDLNRRITAVINETIPGVNIKLSASAATATGAGQKGTSSGTITLTTSAQTIISGIGGAYTGNGINNGHQLNISLETTAYNQLLQISNKAVIITYTITE